MNERIKQLADLAREQTEQFNSIRNKITDEEWEEIYNEKFAELIVKECLDIVEKQLGGGNGDGVEWDRAIDFTYEDMKKHFGVEE